MVKYHFFLLINVFFLVVAVSTWDLARELADQPMKFINKIALSLPGARNFFLSYVLLSGIGIMPLQLVQLAVILPRWFYRIFLTRTPRGECQRTRYSMQFTDVNGLLRLCGTKYAANYQPRNHLPTGPCYLPHVPDVLRHLPSHSAVRHHLLWHGIPRLQSEPDCTPSIAEADHTAM